MHFAIKIVPFPHCKLQGRLWGALGQGKPRPYKTCTETLLVVFTNEELMLARETHRVLAGAQAV
jgi:hypothetical protein